MTFNSLQFWLIFPIIFGIYWLIPVKCNSLRKAFLIIVSYLLYMNWKPAFAIVLLLVTIITYGGGYLFGIQQDARKRKRLVWLFAVLGLLPLLTFKYYNFLNESIAQGLETIGLRLALPGLNWAIPIGISFFTFQAVGYMLDVYHKRIEPERNIVDYVLFVSFFPQVTSGPISKADELLPQIKSPHRFEYGQGKQGLKWLLWGMFIKMAIADRLGMFVDTVYADYIHYSGTTCFVASIFYSLQIYCDFAGYSLMAIGIAATLGFNLINNFKRPYLAVSVTDFWKRWHISLTRWLTQHVYIPLGGSRCSKARNYLNIMITFLVSGIWHGASWTFIFWGAIHGVLQSVEKFLGCQKYEGANLFVKFIRISLTFLLVNFAWIFFRMPSLSDSIDIIRHIFTWGLPEIGIIGIMDTLFLAVNLLLLVAKDLSDERFFRIPQNLKNSIACRWIMYIFIFLQVVLNYSVEQNFIYYDF